MLAGNRYSGKVTTHGARRIMKAVDMLLQRNPKRRIWNPVAGKEHDFQVGFWTLTIPTALPIEADRSQAELLQPFLRTARRKWNVTDYIWKAELQRRGQLHYHITTSKFVAYTDIRGEWNKLLHKARLLDDYGRRFKHFNPNSTDVHAVWKVRNLKNYLAKYIAKEEQNQQAIKGKVWDCSRELKRKPFAVEMHGRHEDKIRDGIQNGFIKVVNLDGCTMFKCKDPQTILTAGEQLIYHQYITA